MPYPFSDPEDQSVPQIYNSTWASTTGLPPVQTPSLSQAWQQTPQYAVLEAIRQRLAGIVKSPLGQELGSRGEQLVGGLKGLYGLTTPGLLQSGVELLEPVDEGPDISAIRTRAIERKLHEETPEATAAKVAAEAEIGDYSGKAAVFNRTGLPPAPKPTMNVTIDGKTYDYSDPNVRAPQLGGGPDPTKPYQMYSTAARRPVVPESIREGVYATSARADQPSTMTPLTSGRPGVSVMEDSQLRQEEMLARETRLAQAQRAAQMAKMSPQEALALDPRVAAASIAARRPSDVQYAAAEYERLWARSQEVGKLAVQQAIQSDPKFAAAAQFAAKGDPQAAQDFATKAQAIAAAAQTQFLQAGSATLGRDPYRPEQSYGIQ